MIIIIVTIIILIYVYIYIIIYILYYIWNSPDFLGVPVPIVPLALRFAPEVQNVQVLARLLWSLHFQHVFSAAEFHKRVQGQGLSQLSH
jgi:hypothetical protein